MHSEENFLFPESAVFKFPFILSEESFKTHAMRGSVPLHFCFQKWKVLLPQYNWTLHSPSTAAQQVQFGNLWNTDDILYVETLHCWVNITCQFK